MQILDVRDSNQVASVSTIDADLGVAGRRLLVLSGIALTDWKYDSDATWSGETQVRLGVFASNMEQWSAFVGLASISNDDSAYVFAADTASVSLDPNSGELLLKIHTALMGEWSYLGRISYQVVATVVRVSPHIAGTITWPKSVFTPPGNDVSTVASQMAVMANRYEFTPHPDSPESYGTEHLTPVAPGQIFKIEIRHDDCVAYYRIDNPPMATAIKVSLVVNPEFSSNLGGGGSLLLGQSRGPVVFSLTGSAPSRDDIDFGLGINVVR